MLSEKWSDFSSLLSLKIRKSLDGRIPSRDHKVKMNEGYTTMSTSVKVIVSSLGSG